MHRRCCVSAAATTRVPTARAGTGRSRALRRHWACAAASAALHSPPPSSTPCEKHPRAAATPGACISRSVLLPQGGAPPPDLLSPAVWDEADSAALQACLTAPYSFLPARSARPPSTYRRAGSLVGMGNGASYLMAATGGFPGASEPQPMVRTSLDAGALPTTLAFVGIVTWHHLAHVFAHWQTQHPTSLWRTNFESRDCECLSAYRALAPPVSTGAAYRALLAKRAVRSHASAPLPVVP